ncbi:MAG: hypothetical protein AMXMBFR82_28890 [Candidatus Hydrogenedentota bacterium]
MGDSILRKASVNTSTIAPARPAFPQREESGNAGDVAYAPDDITKLGAVRGGIQLLAEGGHFTTHGFRNKTLEIGRGRAAVLRSDRSVGSVGSV